MGGKKRKIEERPVFDSIRKPVAPPSRKIGPEKAETRAHPSMRKVKHKKKFDPKEADVDL